MCFDGAKSFCVDDRRKPFDCTVLDALLISDVIYTILCTMRAFYAKLIKIRIDLCINYAYKFIGFGVIH